MFRLADRVEYRSDLRQQRDRLQARLGEAVSGHEQALAVLGEALAAEKAAAGPLADALRVRERAARAEETARRLRKGAEAETEAAVRLSAAARVLARYQAESTAVARAREAAEAAAGQAAAAVRACEEERDRAQALLEQHAAVPLSRETVFALLFPALRMAYGSDADGRVLDQAERAMVGVFGDALRGAAFSEYAGALARADEERVRKQLREEFLTQPHLRRVGPGMLAAAWVNAPKPSGGTPANAVVTPPPSVRPDTGFQGSPGLYQNPTAQ